MTFLKQRGDNKKMIIEEFISTHKLPSAFKDIALDKYVPLAEQISSHQKSAETTYFVGINGCQGSGKSTLSDFIKVYIEHEFKQSVTIMSLDDFYFSQAQRRNLADKVHPLLKTRGVPGTHDTQLAKNALEGLATGSFPVIIPRFNKATDNPFEKDQWTHVDKAVDIVIFEGWCWGVEAQAADQLNQPINALEKTQDKNGTWRQYVNTQLNLHYQPLYDFMNMWVMFKAPSFSDVYAWRLEQEEKLAAALAANSDQSGVMNAAQIMNFIQYYQRLTTHCLDTLPSRCHHVFELDSTRKIVAHKTKVIHD